jgi:hypothetical protein
MYNRSSLALVVPDLLKEPTDVQYMSLIGNITTYFESTLKKAILEKYNVRLDKIVLSNYLNLFNKGIPEERFNILLNFEVSASYSNGSISDKALFESMKDSISVQLITEVIWKATPFERTNEVTFLLSDF